MPTAPTSSLIDGDVVIAERCQECLAEGVAQSVVTVLGHRIVLVALRCRSCGHHWMPNVRLARPTFKLPRQCGRLGRTPRQDRKSHHRLPS